MNVKTRNNVQVIGDGPTTLVFVHGFGCDQSMWRSVVAGFSGQFRTILLDLVGCGRSDLTQYDRRKYATLNGHAQDVLQIIDTFARGPVVLIGHSVGAIIGMLASVKTTRAFVAQVLVAPSPYFMNDADYIGGFWPEDIDALLDALDQNYIGWSKTTAPVIMGAPDEPEHARALTDSFCRMDPDIASHFARVTFRSDYRSLLKWVHTPSLILQSTTDSIAPTTVGEYMLRQMPAAQLELVPNVGHCPHISSPRFSVHVIQRFLIQRGLLQPDRIKAPTLESMAD